MDNLLIKVENEEGGICLITDNHKHHILGHLRYSYKPRIIKHIFNHLYLWFRAKRMGIPHISLEEILFSRRK